MCYNIFVATEKRRKGELIMNFENLGNAIFATGIGAALITQSKSLIQFISSFFRIGYTITVNSETHLGAFLTLRNIILQHKGNFHKTASFDTNYSNEAQLGYGHFFLFPMWNQIIIVNHEREKREQGPTYQTLTIHILGYQAKERHKEILSSIYEKLNTNSIEIMHYQDRWSTHRSFAPKRDFTTIFHPKKEEVIHFLEGFLALKPLYHKNGLPCKTGILLYGPPGTGKTSMIKAIATFLGWSITVPDTNLDFDSRPETIVCVEDIDRFLQEKGGEGAGRGEYKETDRRTKLHKLLQTFDGLSSFDNVVFVATTNHIEDLPPELIRDGRFDYKIELGNIDRSYAEEMCKSFGVELEEVLSKEIKEAKDERELFPVNPAYLQNKILRLVQDRG